MRKGIYGIIGTLIVAGGLLLLATHVDFEQIAISLRDADVRYFIPAIFFTVLALYTRAVRWHLLLGKRMNFWRCFHISNIGYMLNSVVPFRLGEFVRIGLANQPPKPIAYVTTASTIVVERVIDILALMVMLAVSLAWLPVADYISATTTIIGILAVIAMMLMVVVAHRPVVARVPMHWVLDRAPVLRKFNIEARFDELIGGLAPLTSWSAVFGIVVWSVLSWVTTLIVGYVLLYAIFPSASWPAVILYTALSAFAVAAVSAVSYVPSALGPYQASVVVALNIAGFAEPAGAPVAFAIILHLITFVVYLALGGIGLMQQSVSLGEIWAHRSLSVNAPMGNVPISIEGQD